jgi:hypothetical protein
LLIVDPGFLDAFGLRLQYVLQQLDEHDFLLHLLLHHLAHVCVFLDVNPAAVFVAPQLQQHALQSRELQIDVLAAVDASAVSCVRLREAVALYQLYYVFPVVAQCLADALRSQLLLFGLLVLRLRSPSRKVGYLGVFEQLQIVAVFLAEKDIVIGLHEEQAELAVILEPNCLGGFS